MPRASWRDVARRVIYEALEEGRAAGLNGEALVAHVDRAYPFGERRMHPYRQWLSERRRQLRGLLPPRPGEEVDPAYWLKLTDPREEQDECA